MKQFIAISMIVATTVAANAASFSNYQQAISSAQASSSAKQSTDARKALQEALSLAKTPAEKAEALISLGRTYSDEKNYKQARICWDQVALIANVSTTDKVVADLATGNSYLEQKDLTTAREIFSRVIANTRAAPFAKAMARMAIASSYNEEKNFAKAREEFSKLVLDPNADTNLRFTAQLEVGETYFSEGNFAEARSQFAKALAIGEAILSLRATARLRIAETYRQQGDSKQAALEMGRYQRDALKVATSLGESRRYAEAREQFAAIVAAGNLRPSVIVALRGKIGELYLAEGNTTAARKELEQLLDEPATYGITEAEIPAFHTVQHNVQLFIASSYKMDGDKQRAREEYRKVLTMPDLDPALKAQVEQQLAALS